MLPECYPALYRDRLGEVLTSITNDGKELRMVVRDVEFTSTMLDDWEPELAADAPELEMFTFECGALCAYTLEFEMPMPVISQHGRMKGTLHVQLSLGLPRGDTGLDRKDLLLSLHVADQVFDSEGKSALFEDELVDIHRQLPASMAMETCLFCAFSAYHPACNDLFGRLDCFRSAKTAFLTFKKQGNILSLYNKKRHQQVQETYHCPEFMQL
jgi:hypothetical protein